MQEPKQQQRRAGPASPKFGSALAQQRRWEQAYRDIAQSAGFSEINLPIVTPLDRFRSRQTGEILVSPGPRFTDRQGVEWAMRSDMTAFTVQFLLEHAADISFPARVAYAGKVFSYLAERPASLGHGLVQGHDNALETFEFGAEIIGQNELAADLEIIQLAHATAQVFGYENLCVVVGDSRIAKVLSDFVLENIAPAERAAILGDLRCALAQRDLAGLGRVFASTQGLLHTFRQALVLTPVHTFVSEASRLCPSLTFIFDPWMTRPQSFYSGLTFEILAQNARGRLQWVGGGGRYDSLFSHFGRDLPAVGFMLKDPNLQKMQVQQASFEVADLAGTNSSAVTEAKALAPAKALPVRIALPKGRLVARALEVFAQVGITPVVHPDSTRKLIIPSTCGGFEFLLVKNADVPSYVEQGVADVAIAGSDVLDEAHSSLLRPLTFNFGSCAICLAGKPEGQKSFSGLRNPRVASKYTRISKDALALLGMSCEVFPLQGSVELASVIDLSDAIIDLVETGTTLRENGLVVYRELARTRVQLVVSRGFYSQGRNLWGAWREAWTQSGCLTAGHVNIDGISDKEESVP